MRPIDAVLEKLENVRGREGNWTACCPAHDDRDPSLSITEGDDGRALLYCHAGCSTESVVASLGLHMADLMPKDDWLSMPSRVEPREGRPSPSLEEAIAVFGRNLGVHAKTWQYHDADGRVCGAAVRWERWAEGGVSKKEIRPFRLDRDGWRVGGIPEPRPLLGLPLIAGAERVIVCEGEKVADAARDLGFVATTSSQGAKAARKTDWGPLAGKSVVILPDCDEPGEDYAADVQEALEGLSPPARVAIVRLPGLEEQGDLADLVEGKSDAEKDAIRQLIDKGFTDGFEEEADDAAGSFEPFPVGLLPEPLARFVGEAAEAIGCDPSYVALPILTTCAAAIGGSRQLRLKEEWNVPSILWTAVVGESGTAKTPSFKIATKAVQERQRQFHAEYELAYAAWEDALRQYDQDAALAKKSGGIPPVRPKEPVRKRLVVKDTTVEALANTLAENPRGVMLACDELSTWFGSFDRYSGGKGASDAPRYLSMFNAESLQVDRKSGRPQTLSVPRASLSIAGGIQPGVLRRVLGPEHRESGLSARFLMAYPPRRPKKWADAEVSPDVVRRVGRVVHGLYDLQEDQTAQGMEPKTLRLSEEALRLFQSYVDSNGQEQMELTGDLAAVWSKYEEYAARLAMVFHCVKCVAVSEGVVPGEPPGELVVDADSMNRGIAMMGWFKQEARRVYAMFAEERDTVGLAPLEEWVEKQGGRVSPREVQQGIRNFKKRGTAKAALSRLVDTGRGRWVPESERPSDGRGEVFELVRVRRQRANPRGR